MAPKISILGIITARSGSKSIPKKNIQNLMGKPLIAYTVEAAKESKLLSRTILSTDDSEIAEIAMKFGCEAPFMRPAELARDDSDSIDVVMHAVNWLKEHEGKEYGYTMILQPTSPLRTAEDIDNCIKIAEETGADSVISMKELVDMSAKKMKRIDEQGRIFPYYEDEGKQSAKRQDLARVYKRNCAVYLTKTSLIMNGDLFGEDSRAYLMPEERSVDINQAADFLLAEFWMMR